METDKLTALLETVRMKSIRKAADILGYTQPGLTYTLNSLEKEFGITLLTRNKTGVSLSKNGEELEPYIHAFLNAEQELRNKISELSGQELGTLRIGSFPGVAGSVLPDIIKEFLAQNPQTEVEVKTGVMNLLKWLEDGTIHLGLVEAGMADGLDWTPLWTAEIGAVVPVSPEFPPNTSVSIERMIEGPLLLHNMDSMNPFVDLIRKKNVKNKIHLSTSEGFAIIQAVSKGLGISFLPKYYIPQCPDSVQILSIDPPVFQHGGIVTNLSKLPNRAKTYNMVKKFIESAQNYQWPTIYEYGSNMTSGDD